MELARRERTCPVIMRFNNKYNHGCCRAFDLGYFQLHLKVLLVCHFCLTDRVLVLVHMLKPVLKETRSSHMTAGVFQHRCFLTYPSVCKVCINHLNSSCRLPQLVQQRCRSVAMLCLTFRFYGNNSMEVIQCCSCCTCCP